MQRVYRSDLRCPHCGSNWMPKAGFSHGKQTYRCGECHHRPSPDGNRHYPPPRVKSQAGEMYGEGMSIAAIPWMSCGPIWGGGSGRAGAGWGSGRQWWRKPMAGAGGGLR